MSRPLRVYNSLTNSLEDFEPIEDGKVKMYVCGPTVYDHAHMGHGRFTVVFDFIRRSLEFLGYDVTMVSNYTDIDDKMIKRANEKGISIEELADEMIKSFEDDMRALNVRPPTIRPYATKHMNEMIEMVEQLVDLGHAYSNETGVYFRVSSYPEYGKLSNRNLDEALAQSDESETLNKESPADFALMKLSKPGEPFWDTPWGKMRPGWHIECSAMSTKYLGHTFDIHGGGQDLLFPHHENELAQSVCYSNERFVNYWLHNGFLTSNQEKMSKSLGNFFTLKEIMKKGYTGEDIRFFILTGHYRKPLEFDEEALKNAQQQVKKIKDARVMLEQLVATDGDIVQSELIETLVESSEQAITHFREAIINDFNTPNALSALHTFIKDVNTAARSGENVKGIALQGVLDRFVRMLSVLGIAEAENGGTDDKEVSGLIELIIDIRGKARKRKDWETSDAIRDKLKSLGFSLEDDKGKTVWKRI